MTDTELYVAQFSPEVQRRLLDVRAISLACFPDAEERIYHGIPTLFVNGRDTLNYGAYRDHITLYLGYAETALLKQRYPQYRYTKAAVKFPHKEPFPAATIEVICRLIRTGSLQFD